MTEPASAGPVISVVIPVYGVAGLLGECLDSVLCQTGVGQSGPPIEVIAVEDHSPDASGALLDERAARDPRLRVIHLESTGGPGHARDTGLAHASGDYVWFVDGDDTLAPGALPAVARKLAGLHPDVLLLDHEQVFASGQTEPGPGGDLLRAAASAAPPTFTLADRPELINLSMTCWSKVFRLAFLREVGVPFGNGIHEDVPVSATALLSARRIGVLDQVCYRYRRGRRTSLTGRTSAANFDIFCSYQRIFNFITVRGKSIPPVSAAVHKALFERAIWHYTVILATGGIGIGRLGVGGLVPRARRREFFDRMAADFTRLRPTGYQLPGGARGAKLRLVERDAYGTYSLLEPVNQLRVALLRMVPGR
ncbi:MAG TPA: glycosyltransferase [Streptosporangiaceae bacterium]